MEEGKRIEETKECGVLIAKCEGVSKVTGREDWRRLDTRVGGPDISGSLVDGHIRSRVIGPLGGRLLHSAIPTVRFFRSASAKTRARFFADVNIHLGNARACATRRFPSQET